MAFPKGFKIDLKQMIGQKLSGKVENAMGDAKDSGPETVEDIRKQIESLQDKLKKAAADALKKKLEGK